MFCRDFIKTNQGNSNVYNAQMNNGIALPNTAMPEQLPLYQALLCDPNSAKASMNNKADSGLTYNIPAPKKRPRDSVDDFDALAASQKHKISPFSSIIDQNVIFQIQQQQSEIDRFIAEHVIIHSFLLISYVVRCFFFFLIFPRFSLFPFPLLVDFPDWGWCYVKFDRLRK